VIGGGEPTDLRTLVRAWSGAAPAHLVAWQRG